MTILTCWQTQLWFMDFVRLVNLGTTRLLLQAYPQVLYLLRIDRQVVEHFFCHFAAAGSKF